MPGRIFPRRKLELKNTMASLSVPSSSVASKRARGFGAEIIDGDHFSPRGLDLIRHQFGNGLLGRFVLIGSRKVLEQIGEGRHTQRVKVVSRASARCRSEIRWGMAAQRWWKVGKLCVIANLKGPYRGPVFVTELSSNKNSPQCGSYEIHSGFSAQPLRPMSFTNRQEQISVVSSTSPSRTTFINI